MNPAPVSISIRGLTKAYARGAPAVEDASIEIPPGELFFLLGPSGCGKTTLLRMLAGFIEPTSGRILFSGRDVTDATPASRNTGMVFQSYALWPHMSVEANVAFGLRVRKVDKPEASRRVAEALASVRMEDYAARRPNQLSGGQQQRVALARAIVVRPDVLLLDEPLSNLDARLRVELRGEIRRICKQAGITTVYVTHDQKEALSMADRVAIMDRGRIVQIGSPADLYRAPQSRFVAEFLGETNFVPGKVASRAGERAAIQTAAGSFDSSHPSVARFHPGAPVVCSIRPEAWRIEDAAHAGIAGEVRERVYLGDTAQYMVRLPGPTDVRIAVMNPSGSGLAEGTPVRVSVSPEDVALVA